MPKIICVFCSSSDNLDSTYFDAAHELGAGLAAQGWGLVYGGSNVGLMGATARTVHEHGGHVIGVIPEVIHAKGIAYDTADELIVTKDLRQRKAMMEDRADGFIALPGGFGTLEEIIEVLTLKQLATHTKPIIFLNVNGFYDPLMTLFEHFYVQRFARQSTRQLYYLAPDVASALNYLETYQPVLPDDKWGG
jgi:uncharacterized protein (TIGR00730 family)